MRHIYTKIPSLPLAAILLLLIFCSQRAEALTLETYADSSALCEGKWVKISISKTGMHLITTADLRNWGFSDPSKVRVYGYGGARIPDMLSQANYIDDLPMVQSVTTDRGIFFFAQGPDTWVKSEISGKYTQQQNPFSTLGYYFLSDKDAPVPEIEKMGQASASDPVTTFNDRLHHESDTYSPGETGHYLVGEDFKYTPTRAFDFTLTDIINNSDVWMECAFLTKTHSAPSQIYFTINGQQLPSLNSDKIPVTNAAAYYHGTQGITRHTFAHTGENLSVGITYKSNVTVSEARLNYLTLNYERSLKLHNGYLRFYTQSTQVALANAQATTHVWDVTYPQSIKELNTSTSGSSLVWTNDYTGMRDYVAWNESATFPAPAFVGNISNQNLHALETPDMVIFTISNWKDQAERIAELHRNSPDSLHVIVVTQDEVFNEFSSGAADANAFRKMLKMMYDRGNFTQPRQLKYALFLGRTTFDNRHLTATVQALGYPTMPTWQTDKGLDDNYTYQTDDLFAFLLDNSGVNMSIDRYCIAVGRMPVRSEAEAKSAVDKLYQYVNSAKRTEWKNQVLIVADDDDNGVHMTQSESMYSNFMASNSGQQFLYNKVYIDAYPKEGNSYPEARNEMYGQLDNGVVWWNYIGHGNTTTLTHDRQVTYDDINNLYLRNLPVMFAATCEFLRWDATATSGAEILWHNPYGGAIAIISALRPVFIADNGPLSANIGRFVFDRDRYGRPYTLGEIYRLGKNELYSDGKIRVDANKLRYVLMGDPAMYITSPSSYAVLEAINGVPLNPDDQPTIMARQEVTLSGSIIDYAGAKMTDFNGVITATIYDAEQSIITNGNGDNGKKITFDTQGGKLYVGRDSVINGDFSITFNMPSEVADNWRNATLSLYACADNSNAEAIGCNRDFFVYGYDESAVSDTIPPSIDVMYLNHETFANGDVVNESPMVIASISDNVGINLSSAGIGHQITLTLDNEKTYTDVSQYFSPDIDSDIVSGTINYTIDDLAEGNHSLTLKIWDTSGNSATHTIDMFVEPGRAPKIYDVYADANPASTETNFYLSHDRPNSMITVTVTVTNLLGQPVWSTTVTGQSDMFKSFPINWDLCNTAGQRVKRGIYLYKAEISTDGEHFATEAKKIAVTAQ